MKKDLLIVVGLFTLIIGLLIVNSRVNIFLKSTTPTAVTSTQVKINNLAITAEVAKTPQTREKGLSQRENLPQNFGMLFVFGAQDRYRFWMKDVKFPLDMIWIDSEKKIADISHSAQPQPNTPENLLRIYQSAVPVKYVLELYGGTAEGNNLRIADQVQFQL